MKPLTIEELKSLKVRDWMWLVENGMQGMYVNLLYELYSLNSILPTGICVGAYEYEVNYSYSDYGKTWLAYKNKEMAESKGEIVELPCKVGDTVYIIDNDRHWAQIDMMRIYNEHNGSKKIVFEWVQLDVGVDVTEVWDDGEFDMEEIGKTVLLEKVHEERIQQLIREENLRYAQWEEEAEAERRLAELRGEK